MEYITLNKFPILHTDTLDLVELKQKHISDIYKLFSDENVTKFNNLLPLKNKDEAQKSIDKLQYMFKEKLGIRWGISFKGKQSIIGTVGFNKIVKQHRAEIGFDLQTEYWHHGYITEAIEAVINFGFNRLGLIRIEAEVMPGNIASEKVLEHLNFKNEGVLRQWMFWNGKYYDMTMFSLLKADYGAKV